jgi:conjugative relaxase-like TrwC/TraI family protein
MRPVGKGERGARRAELYYEKTDAGTDAGYYQAEAGLHSEWIGDGAQKLGLADRKPDYEHFKRLIRGLDPWTGDQLSARLRDDRIPAWDITVSMPKGPTLAIEQGDLRVLDAFRQSYRQAFAMLQRYATTRVRIDGQQEDRVTGNLLGYAIEHPDTRPVEDESLAEDHPWRVMPLPDWHAHIVVPNATWDPVEERWKAVKFRPLMDLRKYFDRSFDATFASKLADLGYEIETKWKEDAKGSRRYYSWDIKGMPAEAIARLSKRTQEIDRLEQEIVAKRKEVDPYAPDHLSPVEKDQLGATSRRVKRDDLTLDECREYWDTLLTSEEKHRVAEVIERAKGGQNARSPNRATEAAVFSMRHHFEKESALPLEELVTTALEQAMGYARPVDIERELKRQGVIIVERDGQQLATTAALQREEEALAGFSLASRGTAVPIGVAEGLTRQLSTGERLTDGQWDAVRGLLASENRVNIILGPAGAGKSKLFRKFDEGAQRAGERVTYLGTTGTSVEVLRKDGFDAHTLAAFLLSDRMQEAARGGRVVVDEVSLLDHAQATRLFDVAKKHDLKLIFAGDPMQHGSVGRGNFIRLMTEHGRVIPFRLTEILRQKDAGYRAAAQLLSEGKAVEGFDALDRLGWVSEIDHGGDRYRQMAADYVQARQDGVKWNDLLVIAPTHRESGFITENIRSQLRERGLLGGDEREFSRLVQVEASKAELDLRSTYHAGDVIQFHQNARGGFTKGQRLVVTDPVAVPVEHADRFSLYRPETIPLAAGDVIRFTGTVQAMDRKHTFKNGTAHAVAGFTEGGDIRLDNGMTIAKDAGHFRSGFVETSIGSQGRTVRRVLLGMDSASGRAANMQQMYVSASRSSESMRLYTDDKDDVRDAIQRDSRKRLALDLKPVEQKREERRRGDVARRQRQSVLARMRAAWATLTRRPSRPLDRPPIHTSREQARRQEREYGHGR